MQSLRLYNTTSEVQNTALSVVKSLTSNSKDQFGASCSRSMSAHQAMWLVTRNFSRSQQVKTMSCAEKKKERVKVIAR